RSKRDWSSDVCSSDLEDDRRQHRNPPPELRRGVTGTLGRLRRLEYQLRHPFPPHLGQLRPACGARPVGELRRPTRIRRYPCPDAEPYGCRPSVVQRTARTVRREPGLLPQRHRRRQNRRLPRVRGDGLAFRQLLRPPRRVAQALRLTVTPAITFS